MTLTPQDVENQVFKEKLRGYSQDEVDAFLDRVADSLATLLREREDLHRRVRALEEAGREASDTEQLLKRTLLAAQRTADETVAQAQAEAEETLADARSQSEQLISEARREATQEREVLRTEVTRIRAAIHDLQRFRAEYHDRVKGVIAEHLALLERTGDLPDLPQAVGELVHTLDERG